MINYMAAAIYVFVFFIGFISYIIGRVVKEYFSTNEETPNIEIRFDRIPELCPKPISTEPPPPKGPMLNYVIEEFDGGEWWPIDYKKTNNPRELIHEQKGNCRVRRITKWEYATRGCR